jgi:hypothetical protein
VVEYSFQCVTDDLFDAFKLDLYWQEIHSLGKCLSLCLTKYHTMKTYPLLN